MRSPFDVCEPEDHLEAWETPETRARNEMWRGEASAEAKRERAVSSRSAESSAVDDQAIAYLFRHALEQAPGVQSAFKVWHLAHKDAQIIALHAELKKLQAGKGQTAIQAPSWWMDAYSELRELAADAQRANWDHQGALPVAPRTVALTEELLRVVPSWAPRPELGAGSSGQITLDWQRDVSAHSLTVEVWPDQKVIYSGLFGEDVFYGTETWHEFLPITVELALRRLLA